MTSRLKHKLELEQINVKSAYLNESFVQIGTPLPALAESKKDKLEYVPEWQQEVRDEKGRRRFHGAFTGGFSAGYYNSVGSKEGWTPSTFKSSRNNRANNVQRPEDFMDEEDLAQMKEDRSLENTETFRSDRIGSTRAEMEDRTVSSALQSLIEPARTSIGQKLLQKQGWRPGQGIGPRISLRKLKMQDAKAGRSSGISVDDDEDQDMGEEVPGTSGKGKHTFAPRDTKLMVYEQKEEKAGLGYVRGMGKGLERAKPLNIRANHVDMGDDDDPYSVAGPSTSRPFAFTGEDEDMPVVIGEPSRNLTSTIPSRQQTSRSDIDTTRWHDGRPVLPGFELDPLGVPADKWFAMPEIPPDWRPRPARVWGTTKKWDEAPGEVKEEKEVIRGQPGKPLTFEQRGEALGEEQRVSKAKSVFEYMSEKDRERIQAIAAAARAGATAPPPLAMTNQPDLPLERPTEVVIPPLSPRTAGAALRGFVPYGDDPSKQDRYRSYLSSQTLNSKTPLPDLRKGTIDEINKELEDFASSARIFKPMSFAMSNRFTSGSASLASTDLKQAKPGLHMFDAAKAADAMEAAKNAPKELEVKKKLTPREQAAEDGRYGLLTRTIKDFYPIKLVCRRFGVQDPHPEGEPKGSGTNTGEGGGDGLDGLPLPKNDASWEDSFIYQPQTGVPAVDQAKSGSSAPPEGSGERAPKTLAEVGMADDVNQGRDTLTYTKPSIDIFKAIFASDDEDSDDDDADEESHPASRGAPSKVAGPTSSAPGPAKTSMTPVDMTTFKPVFQVKREREEPDFPRNGETNGNGEETKKKDREKKRKKEKKAKAGALSFQVDDEGETDFGGGRKRRMERPTTDAAGGKGAEEGDEVWVEKKVDVRVPVVPVADMIGNGQRAGRKGAADYM